MSNRSETDEYNVFYEDDSEFEYDEWPTDLAEVQHFYDALSRNPAAQNDYEQAVIVRRTKVVFHTDWEPVDPA